MEKKTIYEKLGEIDRSIVRSVEEETLDPYPHALVRLRAVGREDVTGTEISRVEERMLRERPKS